MRRRLFLCAGCFAWLAWPAFAQTAGSGAEVNDPMASPTEYGIRLTPGMARAMSRWTIREVFVKRYELDESRVDEATELMARRIMQFAHEHEAAGRELIEFAITEALEHKTRSRDEGMEGMPLGLARGIGTRLLPVMPSIRDATDGVMQDIRPMLSLKQQIRFTGEVTAVNVALDAFDKNMQRWAAGDVDPFGDPFKSGDAKFKKDADGQTQTLKRIRGGAEADSRREPGGDWDRYVEQAKQYYQLDESQAAAADSLLRDYKQRAKIAVAPEDEHRAKVYQNSLWCQFATELPGRWWGNPLNILLYERSGKLDAPVEALGEELRGRIDEIPTRAQREAAESRVWATFAEKGLKVDEFGAVNSAPAAGGEKAR
jgi:hypothetical protein